MPDASVPIAGGAHQMCGGAASGPRLRPRPSYSLPTMDFSPSNRVEELSARIAAFLDEHVYPVELEALKALDEEVAAGVPYPEILVDLRERAKAEGLWNLFLPGEEGAGLTN